MFAQHCKLEFANSALHPEQHAIILITPVIDAAMIEDSKLHETADFQNIMPIPTSNKLRKNSPNTHRPRQNAF